MLDGVSIAGYRSFGNTAIRIPNLDRMNVFIGPNNCGKSNILRAVKLFADASSAPHNNHDRQIDPSLDYPVGGKSRAISFGVQVKRGGVSDGVYQKFVDGFGRAWNQLTDLSESYWASFSVPVTGNIKPADWSVDALAQYLETTLNSGDLSHVWRSMFNRNRGGAPEIWAKELADAMHSAAKPKYNAYLVNAFRRITDSGDSTLTGAGLIGELRKLQSPDLPNYQSGKLRFSKINGFLQDVLGEPEAKLEIPAALDQILVTLNGKVLPLESLGTGIHELIILAAAVTLVDEAVFCLEEPEIHLHPALQKKFMRYIDKQTSNQYLIATHSNAFFDLDGVNLYSCGITGNNTTCKAASSAGDKHAVLQDLGYRPSDLLQANYLIWAEGPSDRIYLNHWITSRAPELVEGLHYAIMFYGGRLLAHLCYDDPMVDDFIKLSCLNRNACILIDSDRNSAHGHLGQTKSRVRKEFETNGCIAWITSGRTIENYVPELLLQNAAQSIHPRAYAQRKWERFADLTRLKSGHSFDKVRVAREVIKQPAGFELLNLEKSLDTLVAAIRKANGIDNQ